MFSRDIVFTLLKSGVWLSLSQMSAIFLIGLGSDNCKLAIRCFSFRASSNCQDHPSPDLHFFKHLGNCPSAQSREVYAQDKPRLIKELKISFVLLTLFAPIILGGFISLGYDFYRIWLPEQDTSLLYILSILTLLPTAISCGVISLEYVFMITNNLIADAIFMLAISITSIVITLYLINTTSLGLYAIAGVSSLLEIGRRTIFWPIYTAKYSDAKWHTFYPDYFKSWLCMTVVIGIGILMRKLIHIKSWLTFVSVASITAFVSFPINAMLITRKQSRQRALRLRKIQITYYVEIRSRGILVQTFSCSLLQRNQISGDIFTNKVE